jgi:hypothetical protein
LQQKQDCLESFPLAQFVSSGSWSAGEAFVDGPMSDDRP